MSTSSAAGRGHVWSGREAIALGYEVIRREEAVVGEARETAVVHVRDDAGERAGAAARPVTCIVSAARRTVACRARHGRARQRLTYVTTAVSRAYRRRLFTADHS